MHKSETSLRFHIGKRLVTAAEYVAALSVGEGSFDGGTTICADIGCDHGYLSIYLIEMGLCDRVYATDINESPINIARENIKRRDVRGFNLCEKIQVKMCDGLSELSGLGINRVVICGMGGEVISGIIDRAPDFWRKGIRFILQPMSSEAELRKYMGDNGFCIQDETLVRDSGRIYTVMCAEYTGEKYTYSQSELALGRHNIQKGGELLSELCGRKLVHARNLLRSENHTAQDEELLSELEEISKKQ